MRKYDLEKHIRLNTRFVAAHWNPKEARYHIITEDTCTGKRTEGCAKIVVTALGVSNVPKIPDIPGLHAFTGRAFHSSRWDHQLNLNGKRVAIIGNGPSAYVSLVVPLGWNIHTS